MMVIEDKCKDLKMKLNAESIEQIMNKGGNQREANENMQNLIKKIQTLEKLVGDKDRQNRAYALKIRDLIYKQEKKQQNQL